MTPDTFTNSHWYAVARPEDIGEGAEYRTRLLGTDISLARRGSALEADAFTTSGPHQGRRRLKTRLRYGHVWTTFAEEPRDIFPMDEFDEPGRRLVTAGPISVRCSGLRAVENFLDMAHFPFVHTGVLGDEEHPEVVEYKTELRGDSDEVWATKCEMYQPRAAAAATGGQVTEYMYRVPHPFATVLYKTCPIRPKGVWDLVGLFIQPREPDECDVHSFVLVYDEDNRDEDLLSFQQMIFMQDRAILENQVPRLLPLDPRSELPTRADASSIAFRRWLKAKGLHYGATH